MNIAIASDHAGFDYKERIKQHLAAAGHNVEDFGTSSTEPVDYPDFIRPAAQAVAAARCERGIILGGSGNGEAMVANRLSGIRCAVCWNEESARLARRHNDANMISLGQRMIDFDVAQTIVDTWMSTDFADGRHRRRIYATRPTVDLADVLLRDAAHIQEEDVAYKKKRHRREGRSGKYPEKPLYTTADVERALRSFRDVDYDKAISVADGIDVVFRDAGHILGSAMLELRTTENGTQRRILFSGDIGQWGKPLIGDPTVFDQADYVVMESTYGDREHDKSGAVETQLCDVINETVRRGGNVVIPTFALERAQELMYYIGRLVYADRIPDVPIFLDSPMAVDVTEIFRKHREYLDEETRQLILSGEPPLRYPGLRMVQAVADSKAINQVNAPCIIMSPAGMCNAGRIKHHLRNNIGRHECTVLFVGFQASGTLGRQILEGNPSVRIHGEMRRVKADIAHINGLSGHADRTGLLRWLSHLQSPPKHVFLTHGEEAAALHLAGQINDDLRWPVSIPQYQDIVELD